MASLEMSISLPNGWRPIDAVGQLHPNIRPYVRGIYQRDLPDGHLTVISCREPARPNGELLYHLSISHRRAVLDVEGNHAPGRIPTWEEIKEARYLFLPDEVNMAMMLPPKRLYINVHETCMHLWEIPMELAE